jgi:hypothetical protein
MAARKSKTSHPASLADLTTGQAIRVREAVEALFNIRRLAERCVIEMSKRPGNNDGDTLLQAIEDIAGLHGKRLHALLGAAWSTGSFDGDDHRRGLAARVVPFSRRSDVDRQESL